MSSVRYGAGLLENRAQHPVRPRQRAQAPDQLVAHARDEKAPEAALAVRDPERGIAGARQLSRRVDQPLQDLLDRQLGGDGEHGIAHRLEHRIELLVHPDGQ